MSDEWFIYVLCDGRTGEVRYVGATISPATRMRGHLSDGRKNKKTHKARWIRGQLNAGTKPTMHIIDRGHGQSWAERERLWITVYRATNTRLLNVTDGGDGTIGYKHTPETKANLAKISAAHKQSDITKAKVSAFWKGRAKSDSHKLNIKINVSLARHRQWMNDHDPASVFGFLSEYLLIRSCSVYKMYDHRKQLLRKYDLTEWQGREIISGRYWVLKEEGRVVC